MLRENLTHLLAFQAVARERSFTRAAAKLGVSPSALSHTLRELEERLGVRLLTRTTRSVAPTEAGERLLVEIAPHFEEIEHSLAALTELRDKPAGSIRITTAGHAADYIIGPKLPAFLKEYPDIKVEVVVDYGLSDIVLDRFDAGVRLGEQVAKDMVAVRLGPDLRMAAVATPGYFEANGIPVSPQDLTGHNCINLRMTTSGGLYAWEFEKAGRDIKVRVDGQLTFNGLTQALNAVLAGCGIAFVPEDSALKHVAEGRLQRVLDDWCDPFPGYHLYYPSRRQHSSAFSAFIEAMRYR